MNQLQQFLVRIRNVSLCNNVGLEVNIILTDWLINLAPPKWRQSQPCSQDLSLHFWAGNKVESIRDADKKFALSVDGLILIELHAKSHLIIQIKRIETMELELSLIRMSDQNAIHWTKRRWERTCSAKKWNKNLMFIAAKDMRNFTIPW